MKAAHCSDNPCVVCGQAGDTNLHYGALCCNGCRNFFRRAVRNNYRLRPCMKGDGPCELVPGRTTKCKLCRMRKCLQSGMKRENVQINRDPIGSAQKKPSREADGIAFIHQRRNSEQNSSSKASGAVSNIAASATNTDVSNLSVSAHSKDSHPHQLHSASYQDNLNDLEQLEPLSLYSYLLTSEQDQFEDNSSRKILSVVPVTLCCSVCGNRDSASFHYGVVACNGCRSFFRRSIILQRSYLTCKGKYDSCSLAGMGMRNACKKCRFQKCLVAGMRKQDIQHPRDTIFRKVSNTMTQRSSAPLNRHSQKVQGHSKSIDHGCIQTTIVPSRPFSHTLVSPTNLAEVKLLAEEAITFESNLSQTLKAFLHESHLHESHHHEAAAAPYSHSRFQHIDLPSSLNMLKVQCYATVEAVKQLECFTSLQLQDQMKLLSVFYGGLYIIDMAQRSRAFDADFVVFLDDVHVLNRNSKEARNITLLIDELLPAFRYLQPDRTEFALLLFIMLWDIDACDRNCKTLVGELRSKCISALEHYVHSKQKTNDGRFGLLLLLTSTVERVRLQLPNDPWRWLRYADPLVQEVFRRGFENS